jgi:NAD(P)-dependent dehydrogenase (short-subunit alcohol dehydrogenase family)
MTTSETLRSARILVVGASAGIGRAFAREALAQGALLAVSARRGDRLAEFGVESGGGIAVAGDVAVPQDCRRIVAEAAAHLGGFDLVLCAAGTATMAPIGEADADAWRRDYEVNVIGPTLVAGAALPHLSPHGLISFLSSETVHETRWGMSSYAAAKSALDATIRSWRVEHPERRFQRVVMGATMPTEFGDRFGTEVLTTALHRWGAAGVAMTAMDTEDVGRHLVEVMSVMLAHPGIDVPDLYLDPRGEPLAALG